MPKSLFTRLRRRLASRLMAMTLDRKPDLIVGPKGGPDYLHRWWVIPRNPFFNVYLHRFMHSDDDRALHDHPWFSLSFGLTGLYTEVLPVKQSQAAGWDYMPQGLRRVIRVPGRFVWRSPWMRHRLEVSPLLGEAWTLFITGPVVREWGFHCRHGWVPWRNFVDSRDKGHLGAGCEGASRKPLPFWKVWTERDA